MNDQINIFPGDDLEPGDVDVLETDVGGATYVVISVPFLKQSFPDVLTATELRIAEMLVRGLSNKEIAAERGTSDRTVANQVRAVFTKCDVASRSELIQKYT